MPRDRSSRVSSRRRDASYSSDSTYSHSRKKSKSKKHKRKSQSRDKSESRSRHRSSSRSRYKSRKSYSRSHSRDKYSSKSKRRSSSRERHKKVSSRSKSKDKSRCRSASSSKSYSKHSVNSRRKLRQRSSSSQSRSSSEKSSASMNSFKLSSKKNIDDTESKIEKAIKAAEAAGLTMCKLPSYEYTEVEIKEDMPTIHDRNILDELNNDTFVQKQFSSSRNKKASTNIVIDLDAQTVTVPNVELPKTESMFNLELFPTEKEQRQMWIKKLLQIRKKAFKGEI